MLLRLNAQGSKYLAPTKYILVFMKTSLSNSISIFRFINQEAEVMHRLLARSGADPELRAKAEYKQRQNNAQYLPTKYSLGYPGKTTKLKIS